MIRLPILNSIRELKIKVKLDFPVYPNFYVRYDITIHYWTIHYTFILNYNIRTPVTYIWPIDLSLSITR